MKKTGWTLATTGLAAVASLAAVAGGGAADADDADSAVLAAREAAAATQPAGYQAPPEVMPVGIAADGPATTSATRFSDTYLLNSVQRSGGYIEAAGRDWPAQDKPGVATTTLRVYGNAAAFRDGAGDLGLNSKFTCTGSGISGVTIGTSGVSVSGGASSSTLTWASLRNNASVLRQYYQEGGHFRCKASNLTFAKFTRRVTASATYKNTDTRAEDSYSFTW